MIGSEFLRHLAARRSQALLIKRIEHLLAFSPSMHQPGSPQYAQVMGNGWLRNIQRPYDIADIQPAAAT